MALANCNLSTLNQAAKCFNCLSSTEKQALKIHFMAEAVRLAGGPDLRNQVTRNAAVACFECAPDFMLESMELAAWQNLTQTFGSTLPTDIKSLRALINCVPCGEQKRQRAAQVVLMCQLSANVSP